MPGNFTEESQCLESRNSGDSSHRSFVTRCVALPSLMAARWVGQNSGPIFRRLWTIVHRIKFASVWVSVACNAVFRLTMSCCVTDIFAMKSRSCPKLRRNFDVFGLPNFGGRGQPNFWQNFINVGHRQTCGKLWWRSAKRPRRLGGEKRYRISLSELQQWNRMAGGHN